MSFPLLRRDALRLLAAPGAPLRPGRSPHRPAVPTCFAPPPSALEGRCRPCTRPGPRTKVRSPEGPSGHLVPAFSGTASYLPSANGSASPCFPTPTRTRYPFPHSAHKAPSSRTLSPHHRPGRGHARVGLAPVFSLRPFDPEPPRAQQLLKSFNANRLRGDASFFTGKGTVRL